MDGQAPIEAPVRQDIRDSGEGGDGPKMPEPPDCGPHPAVDVVADDRERNSGVVEQLGSAHGLRVTVRRLDVGDYLLNGRIVVERKTIADLAASLADGRLFTQACRLAAGDWIPAMVIEGAVAARDAPGVSREAVQGAMVSLALFLGIPCLRSADPAETARLLRYIADQMRRKAVLGVHRPGYRPRGARKRRLFVLQGLPGVGPARAESLLEAFGSLESVFTASETELAAVPGMGPATARAVRSLVAPAPPQTQ
jgi:DNA excision repair protein ERCC-4